MTVDGKTELCLIQLNFDTLVIRSKLLRLIPLFIYLFFFERIYLFKLLIIINVHMLKFYSNF